MQVANLANLALLSSNLCCPCTSQYVFQTYLLAEKKMEAFEQSRVHCNNQSLDTIATNSSM